MKPRPDHAMFPRRSFLTGGEMVPHLLLLLLLGCSQVHDPMGSAPTTATASGADLSAYYEADRRGVWFYQTRGPGIDEDAVPVTYVRAKCDDRVSEGILYHRQFGAIADYLVHPPATTQPAATQPAPLEGGTGLLFVLDQPTAPVPDDLAEGSEVVSESPVTYFDNRGKKVSTGTLRRRVAIEGYADIECPAGEFADCLQVRIELQIYFPWIAIVNLTSDIWLSKIAGEVKRVQKFSGWFLIFPFSRTDEYSLIRYRRGDDRARSGAPRWACGAILFTDKYPHPAIGGMIIDLAEPACASQPPVVSEE